MATLTAATVVLVGVEQGIVVAIVASIIDHLRRSYRPATAVLAPDPDGNGVHSVAAAPGARTRKRLVVYRYAASLYYANAEHFSEDVLGMLADQDRDPVRWFCLDATATPDIDYTGADKLRQIHDELKAHRVRLVFSDVMPSVRGLLDRYGITELVGEDAYFDTIGAAVSSFEAAASEA